MMLPKQDRKREPKHRAWIASLPCCVSGIHGETQAAHISSGRASMGMKQSDHSCVPLSWQEHAKQHSMSEIKYWEPHGGIEKAKGLANALAVKSGDTDYALMLLARFKK